MNLYKAETIKAHVKVSQYLNDQGVKVQGNRAVATWRDGSRMSVSIDDGQGLFHDFMTKEGGDIIALCMKVEGLDFLAACKTLGDRYRLAPDKTSRKPPTPSRSDALIAEGYALVKTYTYTDEAGTPTHYVERWERMNADGKRDKTFTQYHFENGKRINSLQGLELPLYNLPNVVKTDGDIYLVEGEKDADTLNERGLVATTSTCGCDGWKPHHAAYLKDKHVVIIADNDKPGQQGARERAKSLASVASSIKVVTVSNLPKGDATDWIEREGGTVEKLREIVANAPPFAATDDATASTYKVRGLWEIACLILPPLTFIWNGLALIHGAIVEFIGAPGIGKSRILTDLARHQILRRPFGGRATYAGRPLKWLFAGSENGIYRLNHETIRYLFHRSPAEMRGMSEAERLTLAAENGFTRDDVATLDANLRSFTLENPDDFDISLGDGRDRNHKNIEKLVKTLKVEQPDILVLDPWGDVIAGDELKDGDVRKTIGILRGGLAEAGLTNTLLIIVNHARMGAKEEANARGTDEGNFGKNSKSIYSISRYVINIRHASFDDSRDIELINAKNNDGEKQPPIALRLDSDTMSYNPISDFDHDVWQKQLEEAAGIKPKKNGGATNADKERIWDAMRDALSKVDEGVMAYKDFIDVLVNTYDIGKSTAERYLTSCVKVGKTIKTTAKMREGKGGVWVKDGNSTLYGLPASVKAYAEKHPKGGKCD